MHHLFSMMIFAVLSVAALGQGTMNPDDSPVSGAEASLSGYTQDDIDLREEEVQMQEDDYDPSVDDKSLEVDLKKEKEEEVVNPTP